MHDSVIQFFKKRRSSKLTHLTLPAPDDTQLSAILEMAARVPDHGKYNPWFFIVFKEDERIHAGKLLAEAYAQEHPDALPAKLELEAERFMRAPIVIAVISKIREGKHSQWEQILSAGALCYNVCLAANAYGFGTNWLTEWYSYSSHFKKSLGLVEGENIAGFIYLGSPTETNDERDRPDMSRIVTYWQSTAPSLLNKGDGYGLSGSGIPALGFIPAVIEDRT